jgi:hypothetical protein
MWSIGALALAMVMTPLYVAACRSLAAITSRGGHRLIAVNDGSAELERLRSGESREGSYAVPDLPGGRCEVRLTPVSGGLRRVEVAITWDEADRKGECRWTTLVAGGGA